MPPNIIFILADDLGWDDVSFHGSPQIPTPNLDVLAADGIILNNYYVQPLCTPSRAALMSGFYPIHTGMESSVILTGEPWGLPLSFKLMPQYLKDLGYQTHMIGKWHLGYYTEQYVPTSRGYDTFYGYYNGEEDYYNHTLPVPQFLTNNSQVGLDFWLNNEPLRNETDRYSTTLFGEQAIRLIKERDPSKPFFLSLCYQAPHGGAPIELQAPSENVDKFPYIGEKNRTIYAGMVDALDQSVGDVLEVLQQERMLENSVIVFSSDNGGLPWGLHASRGFNWPLRGAKGTLWEGATRAAAFLWSPLVTRNRRVSHQLMHIVDWLPTLYRAAGGDPSKMKRLDGHDMWLQLCADLPSPRVELLYNIDPRGRHGGTALPRLQAGAGRLGRRTLRPALPDARQLSALRGPGPPHGRVEGGASAAGLLQHGRVPLSQPVAREGHTHLRPAGELQLRGRRPTLPVRPVQGSLRDAQPGTRQPSAAVRAHSEARELRNHIGGATQQARRPEVLPAVPQRHLGALGERRLHIDCAAQF
ncbi:arylsulfatase B-like [Dermacentor silvarum]|uniref:arylsulfatase B-like n=1 Tax=Dermacentor silvarum TaxID=543639 RepID=UPI0021011889|nr:arylsulfatase B-like [Dermacentor silvarum]